MKLELTPEEEKEIIKLAENDHDIENFDLASFKEFLEADFSQQLLSEADYLMQDYQEEREE